MLYYRRFGDTYCLHLKDHHPYTGLILALNAHQGLKSSILYNSAVTNSLRCFSLNTFCTSWFVCAVSNSDRFVHLSFISVYPVMGDNV
jgi:hypothetical protein